MSLTRNDNLEIRAPKPVDTRMVVSNTAARDAIAAPVRFEGLRVYISETFTWYTLKGGIEDANWVEDGRYSFDPNVEYIIGDSRFYQGRFYIANTDIVAGTAWNPDNWSDITTLIPNSTVAGHVIEKEGTPVTQRGTLNFVGSGVSVLDNAGKTEIEINAGALTDGNGISIDDNVISLDILNYITSSPISFTTNQTLTLSGTSISNIGNTRITAFSTASAVLSLVPTSADGASTRLTLFAPGGEIPQLQIYANPDDGVAYLQADTEYNLSILAPSANVSIQGIIYPATDGTSGQVLSTNGAGSLGWTSLSAAQRHIVNVNDSPLTDRTKLNFAGSYWTVVDDAGTTSTDVSLNAVDGSLLTLSVRKALAVDLAAVVLAAGEFVYATDTKELSIGDGTSVFADALSVNLINIINQQVPVSSTTNIETVALPTGSCITIDIFNICCYNEDDNVLRGRAQFTFKNVGGVLTKIGTVSDDLEYGQQWSTIKGVDGYVNGDDTRFDCIISGTNIIIQFINIEAKLVNIKCKYEYLITSNSLAES